MVKGKVYGEIGHIRATALKITFDIRSRYYTSYLLGLMVIFGRSVFYLFGRSVSFSAVQFYIFLVVQIRPYGPVWTHTQKLHARWVCPKYHSWILSKIYSCRKKLKKNEKIISQFVASMGKPGKIFCEPGKYG